VAAEIETAAEAEAVSAAADAAADSKILLTTPNARLFF
jgi:hypothetical protein